MKALVKMYDPEGNIWVIPVTSEEKALRLISLGWKPAEKYSDAKNRNFPVLPTVSFAGSVRFSGHRERT